MLLPSTWSPQINIQQLSPSFSYSPYPIDQQALWIRSHFLQYLQLEPLAMFPGCLFFFFCTSRNSFLITAVIHISSLFLHMNYIWEILVWKTDTFLGRGKPTGTNSQLLILGSKGDPFNPTSSKNIKAIKESVSEDRLYFRIGMLK